MKVLVTGSSGFLGKGAVYEALERGHNVSMVDIQPPKDFRIHGYTTEFLDDNGFFLKPYNYPSQEVRFFQADIADKKAMGQAFEGIDLVIHTAAIFNHHADYETYARVNVLGSKNVRDLAFDYGIKCIVNYGAGLGYGSNYQGPIKETDPLHPEDPYSQSKVEGEEIIFEANSKNLETILLRIFGAYGEEQVYGLPTFLKTVYNGFVAVPGKKARASYIHRDDISAAALYLAENHHGNTSASYPGETAFNMGDKTPATMCDLSKALNKVKKHLTVPFPSFLVKFTGWLGDKLKSKELNSRITKLGLNNYVADISKLESTGFQHRHPSVLESMLHVYQHYAGQWDAEKGRKLLRAKA